MKRVLNYYTVIEV